jgi:AcrR family transcriptional regulator
MGERRGGRPSARPRVRAAFEALVGELGFADLTVEELARRAGVSRMTFYAHWSNKYELLAEVAGETVRELAAAASGWLEGPATGDPREEVARALGAVLAGLRAHAALIRATSDAAAADDRVNQLWDETVDGFAAMAARRIRRDQAAGLAREDIDPESTARALCWMIERVLYRAGGRSAAVPSDAETQAMAGIWLHALYPG